MIDERILEIAREARARGGRALVVGGYVRDRLLGVDSKDLDVEVYGLDLEALGDLLGAHGEVLPVGRAFGVLRVKGLDVDFSLPRRDSKTGPGHRGFDVAVDPGLDFATAARRRDLTINSMALDPLDGEILDAHGGRADLEAGRLRATDPERFAEDPLRGLRAAQFAARLEMTADAALVGLCRGLDLSEVSPERIFEEMRKLLLKGRRPSLGFAFLRETGLLAAFPELEALIGVPQDRRWHPEGDVWVHNQMVIDEAAKLRDGGADDLALMFGALCHDLGKPATTFEAQDGRIRSPRHDVVGVALSGALLARMRAPHALVRRVAALVEHHLAPTLFVKNGATAKGYRRLARKLAAAGVSMELLLRVARADHLGRTTAEALARRYEAGCVFARTARELLVEREPLPDAVLGRHLLERGLAAGPGFAAILARCREVQDETGWTDPAPILDRVLPEFASRAC